MFFAKNWPGVMARHLKKAASSRRLAPVARSAKGLQVRQLASSTSSERDDVVDGQVVGRSTLGAVRLARKLHLPERLPCTTVATLGGGASALPLLPFVLAQAIAAAGTAVVVREVAATASVADAELHLTLAGAQSRATSGTVSSAVRFRRPSSSLCHAIEQMGRSAK